MTHYNNWPPEIKQYFIDNCEVIKPVKKVSWSEKFWNFLKSCCPSGENLGFHYTYGFVYEGVYPTIAKEHHDESCEYQITLEIDVLNHPDILLFFKQSLVHNNNFQYHYDLIGYNGEKIHDIKVVSLTEDYPHAYVVFDILKIDLKNSKAPAEIQWK